MRMKPSPPTGTGTGYTTGIPTLKVLNYEGGEHVFSDGSDVYHADYFSGWDVQSLQVWLVWVES